MFTCGAPIITHAALLAKRESESKYMKMYLEEVERALDTCQASDEVIFSRKSERSCWSGSFEESDWFTRSGVTKKTLAPNRAGCSLHTLYWLAIREQSGHTRRQVEDRLFTYLGGGNP